MHVSPFVNTINYCLCGPTEQKQAKKSLWSLGVCWINALFQLEIFFRWLWLFKVIRSTTHTVSLRPKSRCVHMWAVSTQRWSLINGDFDTVVSILCIIIVIIHILHVHQPIRTRTAAQNVNRFTLDDTLFPVQVARLARVPCRRFVFLLRRNKRTQMISPPQLRVSLNSIVIGPATSVRCTQQKLKINQSKLITWNQLTRQIVPKIQRRQKPEQIFALCVYVFGSVWLIVSTPTSMPLAIPTTNNYSAFTCFVVVEEAKKSSYSTYRHLEVIIRARISCVTNDHLLLFDLFVRLIWIYAKVFVFIEAINCWCHITRNANWDHMHWYHSNQSYAFECVERWNWKICTFSWSRSSQRLSILRSMLPPKKFRSKFYGRCGYSNYVVVVIVCNMASWEKLASSYKTKPMSSIPFHIHIQGSINMNEIWKRRVAVCACGRRTCRTHKVVKEMHDVPFDGCVVDVLYRLHCHSRIVQLCVNVSFTFCTSRHSCARMHS